MYVGLRARSLVAASGRVERAALKLLHLAISDGNLIERLAPAAGAKSAAKKPPQP